MKTNLLLLSIALILPLAACSSVQDQAPVPTAVPAVPAALPASEADPYALARQLLEQADYSVLEGWLAMPCEGEAVVLCISDGQQHIGYTELLIYPLSGYAADHPLRLAATGLPPEPATYSADHVTAAGEALVGLADEHLAVIAADRAITFPDDLFAPLDRRPAQMGALPALTFGFVRTNEQGTVQERYLNVAAFDQWFLYWLGINYDPGNVSSFASDAAIEQFEPALQKLAARLPIHTPPSPGDQSPPPMPPLTSYSEHNGELPADLTWVLAADLPWAKAAVDVLSQPAQTGPLAAEQAAALAETFGFNGPLYVEARPGLTVEQAAQFGLFVAFEGSRTLSLSGMPYHFSDVANWNQGLDLPFAEAAPIAERFLQTHGWLTFPYTVAESTQGEGVLFLPIIDGVQLLSPAYGVRVAGNSEVASMFIYAPETLAPAHAYPIMTAEEAWVALQDDRQQHAVFYRLVPPVMEASVAAAQPIEYSNIPAAGEQGDFYTNIWAFRTLAAEDPPILISSDFFRIRGSADLLDELAEQSDYLVHLWGTVLEPEAGLPELALSRWEVNKDAGGLPVFFGFIEQDGGEKLLVDGANAATYRLPGAPHELAAGDYAAVSGLPETAGDMNRLLWQKITVYPSQPAAVPWSTAVPIQTITIDSVRLVYLPQPAGATGLAENLYIPAWEFGGMADGGTRITVWVTAVKPEFFGS